MIPAIIAVSAFVLIVIIFAACGLKVIKQSETMVIERLGKYKRTLNPGINIVWPLFEKPKLVEWQFITHDVDGQIIIRTRRVPNVDLRETLYDFPPQNVITKDNVAIEINALLYFRIMEPRKTAYEVANLPDVIEKLTQTTLRNVIGELDLDETLASRDTINNKLRAILDEATDQWGVKVTRVELQDVTPPGEIKDAMEKQMRAERDRRAAILTAEGDKRSKILESEGLRESLINRAEAEKRSKILMAEGEAEARIRIAQAEAEAIAKLSEVISGSNGDPANYLIAVKYIEALKEMVSGKDNKVVYLPFEATGILSSIGGIKEMLEGATRGEKSKEGSLQGAAQAGEESC